jgi:hypothetical protein
LKSSYYQAAALRGRRRVIMASRFETWEVGDYCKHFLKEAEKSDEETFKEKFHALGGCLETLDAEFLRESAQCGRNIGDLLSDLHSLAGRLGYCEVERGYKSDCTTLYKDVDAAIEKTLNLEESCFV